MTELYNANILSKIQEILQYLYEWFAIVDDSPLSSSLYGWNTVEGLQNLKLLDMHNVVRISPLCHTDGCCMGSKRNINQINPTKLSSICLKYMYKHAKWIMFAHETARETVVFICLYRYMYTILFELVPYVRGKHLKSFRVANLS